MPKRSTPFQAIVRLVRQHFAQAGVTITESKMLRDAVLDIEREVDIVIEGKCDGEPMVISVEVIEHGRVATLPWVEQILRKHRDLPTNRLLLVSKSGFSGNAQAAIQREAGRVQALTPEVIEINGEAVVKHLFFDTIDYKPTGCKVHVRNGDERIVVVGIPLMDVYAEDESLLGPLSYLVQDTVGLGAVRLRLLLEAHQRPEKDQVKAFSVNVAMPQLGYHLQQSETGQLHLIEELEIWGDFAVSQTEVPLTLTKLGGRYMAPPKRRSLAALRCGWEPPIWRRRPRRSRGRPRTHRLLRSSPSRSGRSTSRASLASSPHRIRPARPTRRPHRRHEGEDAPRRGVTRADACVPARWMCVQVRGERPVGRR